MFGHRYFGARFFGPRYFGGAIAAVEEEVVAPRATSAGGWNPNWSKQYGPESGQPAKPAPRRPEIDPAVARRLIEAAAADIRQADAEWQASVAKPSPAASFKALPPTETFEMMQARAELRRIRAEARHLARLADDEEAITLLLLAA